ncbi:MAG: FeS assembly protein [Verrucomicrobia bacterium]|jgi:nitrogen fixation protein NifU and related proteins|nr:FeS assembly protein [Verrucomicrobiota bacterium]
MTDAFQLKVEEAMRNPKNLGEMEDADTMGTVGGAGCGDMLRMWLKFKDKDGKQVIDKASFQSFGCETAIAAASMATEMLKGKTTEEAVKMSGAELAADLGPLPPTKIHCTTLVEDAIRTAIESHEGKPCAAPSSLSEKPKTSNSLLDTMHASGSGGKGLKVILLPPEES